MPNGAVTYDDLSKETQDVVKLNAGTIATLTAMVLGLLGPPPTAGSSRGPHSPPPKRRAPPVGS